jgi:hypothetical protein
MECRWNDASVRPLARPSAVSITRRRRRLPHAPLLCPHCHGARWYVLSLFSSLLFSSLLWLYSRRGCAADIAQTVASIDSSACAALGKSRPLVSRRHTNTTLPGPRLSRPRLASTLALSPPNQPSRPPCRPRALPARAKPQSRVLHAAQDGPPRAAQDESPHALEAPPYTAAPAPSAMLPPLPALHQPPTRTS